jgi:anti-sigma B factor antagonist
MTQFEVRTSAEPGRVVVALAGECDLATKDELASALRAAVTSAETVVVDVAELEFLDSSGVHGLVAAHRATLGRGGRLYVVNARGPVAHVLDMTGVAELLKPPAGNGADAAGRP